MQGKQGAFLNSISLITDSVEELKSAVFEWQKRHEVCVCLTTGFLEGNHPIVDAYELKLRLEHVLRRLRILEESAHTAPPLEILDYLYLGNAVASQACYTMKDLGITHILNATLVRELKVETIFPDCSREVFRENKCIPLAFHSNRSTARIFIILKLLAV